MPWPKNKPTWNVGKKFAPHELPEYHQNIRLDDEQVFVENSTYPRHRLKKRVMRQSLITYECQICGMGPEWQGKPMPLILDHINGVNNDNRIENLRFVCSNCDSQLTTYKSRNKGRTKNK